MYGISFKFDEQETWRLVSTGFWNTSFAKQGGMFLASNGPAFQLLLTNAQIPAVAEAMRTATEVIVTRGPWDLAGGADGMEVMFEDGSDSPFSIHLAEDQCLWMPPRSKSGSADLRCTVSGPGCVEIGTFRAKFRWAREIPCLKPWGEVPSKGAPLVLKPAVKLAHTKGTAVHDVIKRATNWSGLDLTRQANFYYVRFHPMFTIFGIAYDRHPKDSTWYQTVAFSTACPYGETATAEPLHPSETQHITEVAFLRAASVGWNAGRAKLTAVDFVPPASAPAPER